MQSIQSQITKLRTNYPLLYEDLKRRANADPREIDFVRQMIHDKRISHEGWMVAYIEPFSHICMRINHPAGYGCTLSSCEYTHNCLFCGERGHGVYKVTNDVREVRCPKLNKFISQLTRLQKEDPDFAAQVVEASEGVDHPLVNEIRGGEFSRTNSHTCTVQAATQGPKVFPHAALPSVPGSARHTTQGVAGAAQPNAASPRFDLSDFPTLQPLHLTLPDADSSVDDTPSNTPENVDESGGGGAGSSADISDTSDESDEEKPDITYDVDDSTSLRLSLAPNKVLASSAHAIVVQAVLTTFDTEVPVAVKMWRYPPVKEEQKRVKEQLIAEVKSYNRLRSKYFVKYEGTKQKLRYPDTRGGDCYFCLIMELCEQPLSEYVAYRSEVLSLAVVKDIARQLIDAYDTCHAEKIMHRDVKPENILIAKSVRNAEFPELRLCDFAFSKVLEAGDSSVMHTYVGTVDSKNSRCWVAPEVSETLHRQYSFSADVWSLGCVLYFVATGGKALFRTVDETRDFQSHEKQLQKDGLHESNPAMLDLIRRMIKNASERICLRDAKRHYLFWSDQDLCDIIVRLVNDISHDDSNAIAEKLQKRLQDPRILVETVDWQEKLPQRMVAKLQENVPRLSNTPIGLLKSLRNLVTHYRESCATTDDLPRPKRHISAIGEIVRKKFPRLLSALFDFEIENPSR